MRKCDHRPEEEGDMTRVTTEKRTSANQMAMIPPLVRSRILCSGRGTAGAHYPSGMGQQNAGH
jgi:hypothetical protein